MIKKVFLLFFVFNSIQLFPLEIDDKLTVKVLSLSETKKTVLMNRGLEDGLELNDHAKFFKNSGVIARGVIVKVSPTRSVWSLYRLSKPDVLKKNLFLGLKISDGLKLTVDPTKDVHLTEVDSYKDETTDKKELMALEKDEKKTRVQMKVVSMKKKLQSKNLWEIFGLFQFNNLSSEERGAHGETQFEIGVERYFKNQRNILKNFSVNAFFSSKSIDYTSLSNQTFNRSSFIYGGGIFYHFSSLRGFTPFIGSSAGVGSIKEKTGTSSVRSGTSSFFSATTGVKIPILSRLGVKILGSYVARNDSLGETPSVISREFSGFITQFGLSYYW